MLEFLYGAIFGASACGVLSQALYKKRLRVIQTRFKTTTQDLQTQLQEQTNINHDLCRDLQKEIRRIGEIMADVEIK